VRNRNQEEKLPEDVTEQPEETIKDFSIQLDGVDIQKGLEHFGYDVGSFINVLRSYAVNTLPLLDSIGNVNKNNLTDYAIIVHGIKGSSRGICAEAVGAMAEKLENAAKREDIDFVTINNAPFIEAARLLIKDITDKLEKMALNNPKPKKDKPDGEVLSKLFSACKDYNMDAADAAMEEMEKFQYESDDGLANWLRENVEMMNFSRIVERLVSAV
jgi:hypothetical protein